MQRKYVFLGMLAAVGIVAYVAAHAANLPNFNTSTGLVSVDTVNGQACIIGTSATCTIPVSSSAAMNGVIPATTTHTSGNIATANTFQSALAANASRKGCMVANTSANIILIDVATAAAATAIPLAAGGQFNCATPAGVVITDQLFVTSATAGSTFVVWAQ